MLDLAKSASKSIPTILVLSILAGGWFAVHEINTGGGETAEEEATTTEVTLADTITLPPGKLAAGRFESEPVGRQPIQHTHVVPGRIRYDESKHVDVKAPMDGILAELLVTPGEHVELGQPLAILRSPEIGQARAEILKRQQQREIAKQVLERETTLEKNLNELSAMLDRREPIAKIEAVLAGQALGSYRQELLAAYSKLLLTTELLEKVQPLVASGSIPGRTVREREAERQMAEAAFRTARDQATFTEGQDKLRAEAELAEADRQLNLAWQAVETLLGYKEDKAIVSLNDEEALSRLEIRAPFAGTVESRAFASNERVMRGDSLVVLANTESLYVSASIRESDWSAVSLQPGTNVRVTVPALDDRSFDAVIKYVGREVAAETNSVPLVATIRNQEALLRPGMFIRVEVPVGERRDALSVKAESVIQHENQEFVFVALEGGTFQRVDVSTGVASENWVEVTHGLSPGQLVVTSGAFLLKSELLLQGETE